MNNFDHCTTMDMWVWEVLMQACTTLRVQAGTVFKIEQAEKTLHVLNTFGVLPWRVGRARFPLTEGICGWVAHHQKPLFVNDVAKDPRFNQQVDMITQFKTVSVLCVPLSNPTGFSGVLELINRIDAPFSENDLVKLQSLLAPALQRLPALAA